MRSRQVSWLAGRRDCLVFPRRLVSVTYLGQKLAAYSCGGSSASPKPFELKLTGFPLSSDLQSKIREPRLRRRWAKAAFPSSRRETGRQASSDQAKSRLDFFVPFSIDRSRTSAAAAEHSPRGRPGLSGRKRAMACAAIEQSPSSFARQTGICLNGMD
jgi:hypothetical protein